MNYSSGISIYICGQSHSSAPHFAKRIIRVGLQIVALDILNDDPCGHDARSFLRIISRSEWLISFTQRHGLSITESRSKFPDKGTSG